MMDSSKHHSLNVSQQHDASGATATEPGAFSRHAHRRLLSTSSGASLNPEQSLSMARLAGVIAVLDDTAFQQAELETNPELGEGFARWLAKQPARGPSNGDCGAAASELQSAQLRRYLLGSSLLLVAGQDTGLRDLAATALQRARFLELMAPRASRAAMARTLFLAGLLSTLDGLCSMVLEEALDALGAPEDVSALLLETNAPGSELLWLVLAVEQGDWHSVQSLLAELQADGEDVAMLYGSSAVWAYLLLQD